MIRTPRLVAVLVAASSLWVATSAESCSKASSDLKKASQGLDALTATCSDLQDSDKAAEFDKASAEAANRSDQSVEQTTADAAASRERHCSGSQNPGYEPYGDVQLDLMK
jgi:hypothetical protein